MLQLAEQPLSCCLLWTNLLGVTLLDTPCSPGVFWTWALCVRLAARRSPRISVPAPFPLCAQKLSGGYFTPSKSRGKELLTLSILKSTVYVLLMVSVFHCQRSPKALKERDCLPIPAHSSVGSVTFVLLKGFPGMDSRDPI